MKIDSSFSRTIRECAWREISPWLSQEMRTWTHNHMTVMCTDKQHYLQHMNKIFSDCRAFSDLFGKFLLPMKLGKNWVILGKNMTILGKNSAIFSKIGKVYLLNWDFSANCEWSIYLSSDTESINF